MNNRLKVARINPYWKIKRFSSPLAAWFPLSTQWGNGSPQKIFSLPIWRFYMESAHTNTKSWRSIAVSKTMKIWRLCEFFLSFTLTFKCLQINEIMLSKKFLPIRQRILFVLFWTINFDWHANLKCSHR